jgi:hypothetical protein
MNNAFERGKREGHDNADLSQDSLQEQEQVYQDEMACLGDLGGDYTAQEHSEYMSGWIAGVRQAFGK